jgi:signal transduction histidine kinase
LETVLTLLTSRIQKHHVEVEKHFADIPLLVIHDGEVRQLITNLITNSLDALPHGGRIFIRTRSAVHSGTGRQGVRLTIADNGIGMDSATKSHLFEPFFSTKKLTGTGLGLWVGRGIVEKHGGDIRFCSRETSAGRAGGTICTVFLPLEAPQAPVPANDLDLSTAQPA